MKQPLKCLDPMAAHVLDNPIRASLRTRHRALAQVQGEVMRYPAEVAPFLAVDSAGVEAGPALDALVPPGDTVYLLGPVPAVPEGWQLRGPMLLAQMVYPQPRAEVAGPAIVELGPAQRPDILTLAALVYPHYFRMRTPELGRYFGIYQDGRLAAMAGERMGTDGWREVSAVCAHPEHAGRGYAQRLLVWLSNDLLARGETPFLHVSLENHRAKELYLRNGYRVRCEIEHCALARPA